MKRMLWYSLYHVYIFHEKTKVFSWMIAAEDKGRAMIKTIAALAFYYPKLKAKDYIITIKKDEADILV